MDARELFPPEIWELIFDKVKEEEDPQDWLNLYRSSSYFQDVIGEEEKLATALFPLVIPHVSEHLGDTLGQLLTFRLLCRPWKEVVDKMLESGDADTNSAAYIRRLQDRLKKSYKFYGPRHISSFLKLFEITHSGNPFVGRYAFLSYDHRQDPQNRSECRLLATRLLDKWGPQLQTLHVNVCHTSLNNCATRILDCVQRSPNLESLHVHCHIFNNRHDGGGGEGELRSPIIDQGLIPPPPLLPKLKSITFSSTYANRRDMLDLQNAVVRLCCHPSSLKHVKTVGIPSALHHAFPNLESADVNLGYAEDGANLPSPPWPLSQLVMEDCFHRNPAPLFKCVEHFKATLTSLHLQCPLRGDPLESKLDLPHLRQLTIRPEWGGLSLAYLTGLTNLESLSIEEGPRDFNRTAALVQSQVATLKLWEVLPKLTKISLVDLKWGGRHDDIEDFTMATRTNREFQRKRPTQPRTRQKDDVIPMRQRATEIGEEELLLLLMPRLATMYLRR